MHETILKPIVSDHFQLKIIHPVYLRPNKIIYMMQWSVDLAPSNRAPLSHFGPLGVKNILCFYYRVHETIPKLIALEHFQMKTTQMGNMRCSRLPKSEKNRWKNPLRFLVRILLWNDQFPGFGGPDPWLPPLPTPSRTSKS